MGFKKCVKKNLETLGYYCDLISMEEGFHSKMCENKYLMTSSID